MQSKVVKKTGKGRGLYGPTAT